MNVRMAVATVSLASTLLAADVQLSVRLERDTILPFEPLYVRVTAVNAGHATLSIPTIDTYSGTTIFDFAALPDEGHSYRLGGTIVVTMDPVPKVRRHAIAPGESLASRLTEVDATCPAKDAWGLPVGAYRLRTGWGMLWDTGGSGVPDTFPTVSFVVRRPDSVEAIGMKLYDEIEHTSYTNAWWSGATPLHGPLADRERNRWGRIGRLAAEIEMRCPKEPYAVIAGMWLARAAARSSEGPTAEVLSRDSLARVCRRSAVAYPNSPSAAFWLDRGLWQLDEAQQEAFLQNLIDNYSNQAVGRRAEALLAAIRRNRGQK
jgi:hypothetical protein